MTYDIDVDLISKDPELLGFNYNINFELIEEDLINKISDQYLHFSNIGIDYIKRLDEEFPGNNLYFERLYTLFIKHVDSVFGLSDCEAILLDTNKTKLYFSVLYELLYVKPYELILDPLFKSYPSLNKENLFEIEPDEIRNNIMNNFLKNLNLETNNMNYKFYNYSGLDIFDTNSDSCVKKFIYNLL
jgi:hypothetical protein